MAPKKAFTVGVLMFLAGCGEHQAGDSPKPPPPPISEPNSEPAEIVGIKLGVPQTISECDRYESDGYTMYQLPYSPTPCWDSPTGPSPLGGSEAQKQAALEKGTGELKVHIAAPPGVKAVAEVTFSNGQVERVALDTDGPDAQQEIYRLLISRFGEPSSSNIAVRQNAFGARFDDIEAQWHLHSMTIVMLGATHAGSGAVWAMTPQALDRLTKERPQASF